MNIGAVHVAGFIGEQKPRRADGVGDCADIASGNPFGHAGQLARRCAAGIDETGRDRVHGNAVGRQELGQSPGQNQDARFGDVVRRDVGLRDHLVGVRHAERNNAAVLAGFHARCGRLAQVENGMEIVGKHLGPPFRGLLEQIHAMVGARAIDQRVESAPGLLHLVHERARRGRIGHVAANRQCPAPAFGDGFGGVGCFFLTGPVTDRHGPVLGGQVEGDRAADPPPSSRNQGHAIGHGASPFLV